MSFRVNDMRQLEAYSADSTSTMYAWFDVVCDDVSDLPAADAIMTPFVACIGSTAHVVSNQLDYEMQSNGTWVRKQSQDLVSIITALSELDAEVGNIDDNVTTLYGAVNELRSAAALLIDNGAKNLLPMTHASGSITRYGVTCTWDVDAGTMTLNGSHISTDSAAIFEMYSGSAVDQRQVPSGDYILKGCPSGGSTSTYRAALVNITGGVDTGSGAEFTLTSQTYLAYRILVSGNVTFSNMVFKPMVTYADYYRMSSKFVPYAPTNAELYQLIRGYHP